MKRKWSLAILALLMAVVFVSGCAKKTVLQEDRTGAKESATVEKQAGDVGPAGKARPAEGEQPAVEARPAEEAQPVRESVSVDRAAESEGSKEAVKEVSERASKPAETAEAKAIIAKKTEVAAAPAKDLYEFADIHFDFDKFNLREEDRAILKKHADWLNGHKDVTIVVEGHCDERGTAEYNLALGERRAKAAAKFLIDLGIDAKSIKTISYGKELPLNPGHNEEAWAMNRRAHFVVSAKK